MAGVFVDAEPVAIGAVDFVWLIIALFGFLVCGAGWVIGWVIQIAFGRIAIFGFHPFGFIGNLIMGGVDQIEGNLVKRMKPLALGIWSVLCTAWRGLYVILSVIQYAFGYIDGSHQDATSQVAALRAQEQADIAAANNRMNRLYNQAVAQEQQAVANLGLSVLSIEAQLKAKEAADATAEDNAINAANARVTSLSSTVTGIGTRVNTIGGELTTVQTTLGTKANLATLNQDVNSLKAADATNLRTAENFATSLVTGLGVAGLRSTLTAVQSQVSKIQTETTECLDPLCDTVTPQAKRLGNLGKYLSDAEALLLEAFFVALAAECLTDPQAVVEDVSSVVHAVGDPLLTAMRDVIGA